MELKDYLRIIGQGWALILGLTASVTLLVIAWTVYQPLKYESSVAVVVNKPNPVAQSGANYFQYDKYYSIQASSLYADTLAAWLASPSTAKEIYAKAGLTVPDVPLKKLSRIFKPRQLPPVTLNVTAKDKDQTRAERLANAAAAILEEKTEEQNKSDNPEHHFILIKGQTVTAAARPDFIINTLVGLVAGLIIGLSTAFLRQYLKL